MPLTTSSSTRTKKTTQKLIQCTCCVYQVGPSSNRPEPVTVTCLMYTIQLGPDPVMSTQCYDGNPTEDYEQLPMPAVRVPTDLHLSHVEKNMPPLAMVTYETKACKNNVCDHRSEKHTDS